MLIKFDCGNKKKGTKENPKGTETIEVVLPWFTPENE